MKFFKKPSKHSCVNCHFLVKVIVHRLPSIAEPNRILWSDEERANLSPDSLGNEKYIPSSECAQGIWSMGVGIKRDLKEIILENRKDTCYFIEKQEDGMTFQAALDLFKHRLDQMTARKTRQISTTALMIAIFSVLVNILIFIIK